MIMLLIDTSQPTAYIALAHVDKIIAYRQWPNTPALGRELLQIITDVLAQSQQSLAEVSRIAVHRGPGHYSALRAGVVTATMLAYTTGAELVAVEGAHDQAALLEAALAATPTQIVSPFYIPSARP